MNITNRILLMLLSWRSIMVGNIVIFGMCLLLLRDHFFSEAFMLDTYLKHIDFNAISSILVAWGVLLESRHLIAKQANDAHIKSEPPEIQPMCDQFSVAILAIGLFMEVSMYLRNDMKLSQSEWLQVGLMGFEWLLLVLALFETIYMTYDLFRIGFQNKHPV